MLIEKSTGVYLPSTFLVHRAGWIFLRFLSLGASLGGWSYFPVPVEAPLVSRPAQQAGFLKVQYGKRMRKETKEFKEK